MISMIESLSDLLEERGLLAGFEAAMHTSSSSFPDLDISRSLKFKPPWIINEKEDDNHHQDEKGWQEHDDE